MPRHGKMCCQRYILTVFGKLCNTLEPVNDPGGQLCENTLLGLVNTNVKYNQLVLDLRAS